jgi:DNA polymerase-3 subunit gamma/tau
MDNFVVSARKYRPSTFSTVVGQEVITNTLKNAIRNQQIAQAFLFTGPRGVGKTTCARIFAKTINCTNLTPEGEACGSCPSCEAFGKTSSFNVFELDAASNNSVDDIRILVDQVRIPPQVGKYKVYIIDEVHMLSSQAFNAFLKTLEEPPPYAKFILATTEKFKIIPTILSRCQIFDFRRINVDDIASHLAFVAKSENVEADAEALHVIAKKADGALRDALSMFDQLVSFSGNELKYQHVIENLNVLDNEYYFRLTDYFLKADARNALLILNEIMDNGFDGQHFVIGLGQHLRNLLVSQDKETVELLETSKSVKAHFLHQAAQCSPAFLLKSLEIINKCDLNYKISNNKRLLIEIALLQICSLVTAPSDKTPDNISMAAEPASVRPTHSAPQPIKAKVQENVLVEPPSPKPLEPPVKSMDPVSEAPLMAAEPEVIREEPEAKQDEIKAPEPVKHAEPEKVTKGNTYSGINISNLMSSADPEVKKANEPNEVLPPDRDAFSVEMLHRIWNEMAVMVHEEPDFKHTLTNSLPELRDNNIIVFYVNNRIQHTEINQKKAWMLDFLRKKLNNYGIGLETLIKEVEPGKKVAYTDEEKFKEMNDKNPSLSTFKDHLGLEFEL